jgi:hypothetical protein
MARGIDDFRASEDTDDASHEDTLCQAVLHERLTTLTNAAAN